MEKEPADFRAVYADLYPAIADLYRKEVLRNTALFSNEQLISSTLAYYKILLSVTFHLWYTVILEEQMVKDIFSAEDYNKVLQIWEKASHPYFESFLFRRKRRLIETLREEKDMQLAAKKLRYLFMDYSEQKSDEEVENFLLGVDRKKEGQEAVLYLEIKTKEKEGYEKWLGGLPPFERRMASYIQFVQEEKDIRRDYVAKINTLIYLLAEEIAQRLQLEKQTARFFAYADFKKGLNWISENKEEIRQREKRCICFVDEKGESTFYFPQAGPDLHLKLRKKSVAVTEELKGQIAMRGKAIGRARVVFDVRQATLEEGDILVTSMTRPEFTPLMQKASAIVTDEGGITSHAAVLSRELKKPCVTGTKNATLLIKDGDIIEVDADQGIIKILKSV